MSLLPLNSEPVFKTIYNPDTEDFTTTYDDDSGPQPYTIRRLSLGSFKLRIAEHLAKHLANKIYNKRSKRTNYLEDIKNILKEIEET